MIEIRKYAPHLHHEWDELVRRSRNGTFLHERAYMDYHSDRFTDCSLMAYDSDRLLAVLPANSEHRTLCSHRGLTYGGWLMPAKRCDAATIDDLMGTTLEWMRHNDFDELIYKPVPHIYHRYPAEEDIYALWHHGAQLTECSISTTIDLLEPQPMDRGNKSGLNFARREGISVEESNDWQGYWDLLTQVLQERHAAQPVHSAEEIMLLHDRFPGNIKLYTVTAQDQLLAGVVMYYTHRVAHSQYIASSPHGRECHALTLLFHHLIDDATLRGCRYFDFGISTEDHGRLLNRGLAQQKSRLGGRGTATQIFSFHI
ncbi:MAG: GNAT family N-acetyltransferase [Muribaculaceae bacterium]|nr:GNAT family N-acetyltransferase [Muribaculaceae bacterium]